MYLIRTRHVCTRHVDVGHGPIGELMKISELGWCESLDPPRTCRHAPVNIFPPSMYRTYRTYRTNPSPEERCIWVLDWPVQCAALRICSSLGLLAHREERIEEGVVLINLAGKDVNSNNRCRMCCNSTIRTWYNPLFSLSRGLSE